ncbi:methyltransferase domain-containing protein [candidate division WOR-3 bacterium]|nr:methyltransferase domain-containing protein [candidate division WOR-3 bacterium]
MKILKKHGITKGRFLEVACGNGRICIPIAVRGFDVTGIDIGASYIEDAKKRAIKRGAKVNFICGDMRRLDRLVQGRYDAVLSIWTSIGYYDKKIDQRIFRMVAKRVRKNGLFLILKTMSQEYLLNHYCHGLYDETDRYLVLHKGNKFDRFHSINTEKWVFYEKRGMELRYVDDLEISLRVYSLAEIVEMAEDAGFTFVGAYDSLSDLRPARPDSMINTVFRKR